MQKRKIIFQLFAGLVVVLSGCIFFPSFMHDGYGGEVVAHIKPQQVSSIDAAVLALGGFKGPDKVQGGDPRRKYYSKRLPRNDVDVSFDLYSGPLRKSDTGWGYAVYVKSWNQGKREDVRAEIDTLLEEVRKVIQQQVGDAKVTVETYRFSPP